MLMKLMLNIVLVLLSIPSIILSPLRAVEGMETARLRAIDFSNPWKDYKMLPYHEGPELLPHSSGPQSIPSGRLKDTTLTEAAAHEAAEVVDERVQEAPGNQVYVPERNIQGTGVARVDGNGAAAPGDEVPSSDHGNIQSKVPEGGNPSGSPSFIDLSSGSHDIAADVANDHVAQDGTFQHIPDLGENPSRDQRLTAAASAFGSESVGPGRGQEAQGGTPSDISSVLTFSDRPSNQWGIREYGAAGTAAGLLGSSIFVWASND